MKYLNSIIIGLSVIIAVWIGGTQLRHRNDGPRYLATKGMVTRDFKSNLAVWSISISLHTESPKSSYATMQTYRKQVIDYLLAQGFSDKEITPRGLTISEEQKWVRDAVSSEGYYRPDGYRMWQLIEITSSDVDKVEKASQEISSLIAEGILINSNEPSYYYTKLADLKLEMLGAASQDARARGERIAQESKGKLGKLRKAHTGVFQILGKNSTDEEYSWGGTYNTGSIEKTATITVSAEYLLE